MLSINTYCITFIDILCGLCKHVVGIFTIFTKKISYFNDPSIFGIQQTDSKLFVNIYTLTYFFCKCTCFVNALKCSFQKLYDFGSFNSVFTTFIKAFDESQSGDF